jgi:hypothetical protein
MSAAFCRNDAMCLFDLRTMFEHCLTWTGTTNFAGSPLPLLRKADGAVSQVDKEAWLRVAQGWLDLIRGPVRAAEQQGDDQVTGEHSH